MDTMGAASIPGMAYHHQLQRQQRMAQQQQHGGGRMNARADAREESYMLLLELSSQARLCKSSSHVSLGHSLCVWRANCTCVVHVFARE